MWLERLDGTVRRANWVSNPWELTADQLYQNPKNSFP